MGKFVICPKYMRNVTFKINVYINAYVLSARNVPGIVQFPRVILPCHNKGILYYYQLELDSIGDKNEYCLACADNPREFDKKNHEYRNNYLSIC